MAVILDKNELIKRRVANHEVLEAATYEGSKDLNLGSTDADRLKKSFNMVVMNSPVWEGSEGHGRVWDQINKLRLKAQNAAMLPDDWSTLTDLLRIDITRRRMQEADYTNIVGTEVVNPGFGKSVRLDEFLDAGAIFKTILGNNDAVSLLEHKTGATGTVSMELFAVGDKASLQELIFNPLYDIEKIMRAVTRGYVGLRNDRNVLGRMVAKTTASGWQSTQQQAADATSGATKEELLYNTLVSAYKKLLLLTDVQTGQTIDTPSVYLAIQKGTEFAFNRAVNGQLNVGGKGKPSNFEAMTWIDAIIPYRGDVIYAGKETKTYAGVASGKAYMFVPRVANWTLTKRGLTMESGRGSVLTLSQEERVWYGIQQEYDQEFFGHSAGLASGSGYCIEISLPTL